MSYFVNDDGLCTVNFEQQSLSSSWYSASSKLPSANSSRNSSFRDRDRLLFVRRQPEPYFFISQSPQPYRTSSLDDIRTRRNTNEMIISRNRCGHRSQYDHRRKGSGYNYDTSRRSSVKSNRSRRNSCALSRSASGRSRRKSSSVKTPTVITAEINPQCLAIAEKYTDDNEENIKRARRHRIAVWLVLSSFIFIAVSSILVVVVTLTHQSEHIYDVNNSFTYYTFAKPSKLANG